MSFSFFDVDRRRTCLPPLSLIDAPSRTSTRLLHFPLLLTASPCPQRAESGTRERRTGPLQTRGRTESCCWSPPLLSSPSRRRRGRRRMDASSRRVSLSPSTRSRRTPRPRGTPGALAAAPGGRLSAPPTGEQQAEGRRPSQGRLRAPPCFCLFVFVFFFFSKRVKQSKARPIFFFPFFFFCLHNSSSEARLHKRPRAGVPAPPLRAVLGAEQP